MNMLVRKLKTLFRLVSNKEQLKEYVINEGRYILIRLGFTFYQTDRFFVGSDERRLLETLILPWYSTRPGFNNVVFTGGQWYTMGYRKLFKNSRFRVMEICPKAARRYGGKDVINDSCANSEACFEPDSLDLVLFTGVFGFGLDTLEELTDALNGFYRALRPGGELLFSLDDIPGHVPFDPLVTPAMKQFEPVLFEPLNTYKVVSKCRRRKTWIFLRKAQ